MDGNGRWAKSRLLPRIAGHKKGVDAVREIVRACAERGVQFLTLFAFSSENWHRPSNEVSLLMRLFYTVLKTDVERLNAGNVRLKIIGDTSAFDSKLQKLIYESQLKTASNTGLTLTIAANYGGRWDIIQAFRQLVAHEPELLENTQAIEQHKLDCYLAMNYAPPPDLFIRTGGEKRISNFLLWQLAYTELYFTDKFWPEFNSELLDLAICSYQQRERRFGLTSEQIQSIDFPQSTFRK